MNENSDIIYIYLCLGKRGVTRDAQDSSFPMNNFFWEQNEYPS